MAFRKVLPEYDFEFHNASKGSSFILLDGEIEIETSLGEKRTFKAGEVLQMDVTGKGHKKKLAGNRATIDLYNFLKNGLPGF